MLAFAFAAAAVFSIDPEPLRTFRPTEGVEVLRFNAVDARLLMAAEGHGFVQYDVSEGRLMWRHDDAGANVTAIAISPDGRSAAFTAQFADVYTYDIYGEAVRIEKKYPALNSYQSVDYSPDGRFIAIGGYMPSVRILDAETLVEVQSMRHIGFHLEKVMFARNGRYVVGSDATGTYVWDTTTGRLVNTLRDTACVNGAFDVSRDLNYVATCDDVHLEVFDVETGRRITRLDGHESSVNSVLFAPDGCCLISAGGESGSEDSIRIWDLTAGKEIQRIDLGTNYTSALALSPDGNVLAVGGSDFIRLYRVHQPGVRSMHP